MAKYCPECGAALVGAGKFCAECGTAVPSDLRVEPATTTEPKFRRVPISDLLLAKPHDWMYDTGSATAFEWQPGIDPAAVPPEVVRSLAESFWTRGVPTDRYDLNDSDFAVTISECPSTPAEVLVGIARYACNPPEGFDNDYDVLDEVLVALRDNPRCPPDVRAQVNRAITPEYISSPDTGTSQEAVPDAASDKESVPEILDTLAGDESATVRAAVADNPRTPQQTLTALAADQDMWVRYAVAGNENAPADTVLSLVGDQEGYVRECAARNPVLANHLALLAGSDDMYTRQGVAENPACPPEILADLAKDPAAKFSALRNPTCPSKALVINVDLEEAITNPNFPTKLLPALAYGPQSRNNRTVRGLFLRSLTRPDCLAASIRTWIGDIGVDEHDVPFGLVSVYISATRRFSSGWSTEYPVDWDLDTNPADLVALADCEAAGVRCIIAAHPLTPTQTLETMCRDTHPVVRWLASENLANTESPRELPETPEAPRQDSNWSVYRDYLLEFSEDPDPALRLFVAAGTEIPARWATPWPKGVIGALARDDDSEVRAAVAANHRTPAPLLEVLAKDRDNCVRTEVARNESVTSDILALLVLDREASVRAQAAGNGSIAADLLPSLAQDASPEVRARVVSNSSTYDDLLRWMAANDADVEIRELAKQALGE